MATSSTCPALAPFGNIESGWNECFCHAINVPEAHSPFVGAVAGVWVIAVTAVGEQLAPVNDLCHRLTSHEAGKNQHDKKCHKKNDFDHYANSIDIHATANHEVIVVALVENCCSLVT